MKREEVAVDHDLAMTALALHPELLATAEGVQISRDVQLSFPIKSLDQLVQAFADSGRSLSYGGRDLTEDEIRKFVPEAFFPVDSEQELMTRLLLAFLIGRDSHHQRPDTEASDVLFYAKAGEAQTKGDG